MSHIEYVFSTNSNSLSHISADIVNVESLHVFRLSMYKKC